MTTNLKTKDVKVKFQIPENKFSGGSKERTGYAALCQEVFGITLPEGYYDKPVTITCWAHEFACFLVRREELGLQNQFRTLGPKLIDYGERTAEQKCKQVFDTTIGDTTC